MEEVDAELLDLVKTNLRILADDEDELLKTMMRASQKLIKKSVGSDESFYKDNDEYKMAVLQLATNYYLNRSATTDVNLYQTEFGYQDLILSLKADYYLWEVAKDGQTS
jgi:uncharacterized phage protein (possible DNA packaging)